ncbi:MAG: hypothetical protein IPM37_12180 [Hahellaceae bacterium]|jgi:hypothetical protein|nr:hypothetical protein [Hahellaceae bacterium]
MPRFHAIDLRTIRVLAVFLFVLSFGTVLPASAAIPTLQEISTVTQSGKLDEAQKMAEAVLQAHPQSAKAHFVNAELLARLGKNEAALAALTQAETLAPGLPFARSEVVAALKARLATTAPSIADQTLATTTQPATAPATEASASSGISNGLLIAAVVALILFAVALGRGRSRGKDLTQTHLQSRHANTPPHLTPSNPSHQSAPGYAHPQGHGYAPQEHREGMGSTLARGLATGAALGAGMVAGQALANQFMGDDAPAETPDEASRNDFGVADQGGWDSAESNDFGMEGDEDWG